MTDTAALDVAPLPDPEVQLRTRIAWYYYIEGLTQSDIARRLGINRVRVNRLLAACRDDGLVQIRINSPLSACVALERALEHGFGLQAAIVVPAPLDAADLPTVLGAATGDYLSQRLVDRQSVGIGWGRTLRCSLHALRRRRLEGFSVVSLIGGLTRASAINTYETAALLANLLGAECYYMAAPAFASSEASRATFLEQEVLREVYNRARRVDLAVVSAGEAGEQSTSCRLGLVSPEDLASLRAAGAVGDLLGHYVDRQGRVVDHPINRRVVGLHPDDLHAIPEVVLVSGGASKLPVLRGVLTAGYCNTLITDETTAAALMAPSTTADSTGPGQPVPR